jgi:DNA-binding GntR family transcriptional regulator
VVHSVVSFDDGVHSNLWLRPLLLAALSRPEPVINLNNLSCRIPPVPDILEKLPKIPNLTEMAYLRLKQRMLDGSLVEGARLTEESLASQLGISKSPVREALNRLESEGLINIQSRRGAHVRRFSIDETRDLFDLRVLLEVHAVGAAKVTPGLLHDMQESIDRTRFYLDAGEKVPHVEEDIRFHCMIAASTGNFEFYKVFEGVQQKTILSRSKTYHLSPTSAPVSHQKIYDALKSGDRAEAQRAMSEHILFLRDSLLNFLRERGEGAMPVEELLAGAGRP